MHATPRTVLVTLFTAAILASLAVVRQSRILLAVRNQGETAATSESPAVDASLTPDTSTDPARLELLRLRNEVRQLRERTSTLAQARAENDRLKREISLQTNPPVPLDQFTAKEALVDAGLSSPSAAIQSFFRAMRDGDMPRLMQCVTPHFLDRQGLSKIIPEELQAYGERLREPMQDFRDFRVVDQRQVSPDEALVRLQSSRSKSPAEMRLKRINEEWKVDEPF
jgi:hypothetical protein